MVVEETVAKVAEERKDEVAADAVASVEKKLETKLDETMEAIEAAAVPMEEIEVGPVGEFLIKWGFQPVHKSHLAAPPTHWLIYAQVQGRSENPRRRTHSGHAAYQG